MNEILNLVEILKDAPKGTKLYSTIYGEVTLDRVILYDNVEYPINFEALDCICDSVTTNGKAYASGYGECTLFPSKDQRDWSKFELDLSIDTPVMVSDSLKNWSLKYYAGNNKAFCNSSKSVDNKKSIVWKYIIPFDKFNPNDIKESLKYNVVNN